VVLTLLKGSQENRPPKEVTLGFVRFASILLVALVLPAAAVQAELVQFKTGYSLELEAYRIEEDKFIMEVVLRDLDWWAVRESNPR
jgi:hypothetical protein